MGPPLLWVQQLLLSLIASFFFFSVFTFDSFIASLLVVFSLDYISNGTRACAFTCGAQLTLRGFSRFFRLNIYFRFKRHRAQTPSDTFLRCNFSPRHHKRLLTGYCVAAQPCKRTSLYGGASKNNKVKK